eukprot:scaffold240537_cov31-Tisochrysis_lutea.AAC.1
MLAAPSSANGFLQQDLFSAPGSCFSYPTHALDNRGYLSSGCLIGAVVKCTSLRTWAAHALPIAVHAVGAAKRLPTQIDSARSMRLCKRSRDGAGHHVFSLRTRAMLRRIRCACAAVSLLPVASPPKAGTFQLVSSVARSFLCSQ